MQVVVTCAPCTGCNDTKRADEKQHPQTATIPRHQSRHEATPNALTKLRWTLQTTLLPFYRLVVTESGCDDKHGHRHSMQQYVREEV